MDKTSTLKTPFKIKKQSNPKNSTQHYHNLLITVGGGWLGVGVGLYLNPIILSQSWNAEFIKPALYYTEEPYCDFDL